MPKQNNKYIIKFENGTEQTIRASRMSEAQNLARKMEGADTIQRVFKNAPRICHNVKGKMHSV